MAPPQKNSEAAWFGDTRIDPAEKHKLVGAVFDSVADRYDLMNDLMSGGIHRLWKNKFVGLMRPRAHKTLLDMAGGTGDIAFRYRRAAGEDTQITVADINAEMLRVGKKRAIDRGYIDGFTWNLENAEKLSFENNTFDNYSISFGLRNVPRIDDALAEAHRVLKPGGSFFCLEFSNVEKKILKKIYDGYSLRVIPRMGDVFAKDSNSYKYLVESIRKFPDRANLSRRLRKAGFDKIEATPLTGGIAAIHIGRKY
ncbi:MAG: bifunctional demethylmenaquinone methyltransferase/2-methoxy-6-polyprenyl-1,4-benzoquinol methylase UbiE [Alphaproteobacteria bacterium]|nr:bifunctional demethylmenaquinone methyltransferase/2-methoxy-6-polyprenyl-1,4-benzoquinol methylase UbiE [Alphaproteobacteria bacterium]